MSTSAKLLTVALCLLSAPVHAQDSCNCLLNLNHMIDKVTHNYAGYKDKVTPATEQQYNTLVDSLRTVAIGTPDLKDCYALLEKYRLFFYDKHLQLQADLPSTSAPANTEPTTPIQTGLNKADIMGYFTRKKGELRPLEGIWRTEGYEVGIMYMEKRQRYEAIIFSAANRSWQEGMLKFSSTLLSGKSYATEYLKGNFGKEKTTARLYKNFLEMEGFGFWQKTFPATKDSLTAAEYSIQYGGMVQFKMLDKKTLYIRLKSCDLANKPILDSLIKNNAEKLKTIPDWIVDFRGNTGGSTDVYQSLLPYFYTKPLIEKGDKHWMTPENTIQLKNFLETNKAVMDTGTITYLDKMIQFGAANPNGWHDTGPDTTRYKKILPYPQHIAVLSDKNNSSSGETFLMVVRGMSDKALVFGENSAGYLDYGDLLPYRFPCNKFGMSIPSRRSNYLEEGKQYSYVGYPPDVFIPATNNDWIQFVFDYWKNH